MKLINLFTGFAALIATVIAGGDYEITYYGCPSECSKQKNPACDGDLELGSHEYFAALVCINFIYILIYFY